MIDWFLKHHRKTSATQYARSPLKRKKISVMCQSFFTVFEQESVYSKKEWFTNNLQEPSIFCANVRHSLGLNGSHQNRSKEHIVHLPVEEVHSVVRLCHHGGDSLAIQTISVLDKINQNIDWINIFCECFFLQLFVALQEIYKNQGVYSIYRKCQFA